MNVYSSNNSIVIDNKDGTLHGQVYINSVIDALDNSKS